MSGRGTRRPSVAFPPNRARGRPAGQGASGLWHEAGHPAAAPGSAQVDTSEAQAAQEVVLSPRPRQLRGRSLLGNSPGRRLSGGPASPSRFPQGPPSLPQGPPACDPSSWALHSPELTACLLSPQVNNENVVKVGHRQVVTMIRQGGNHLVLKVVTVTRSLDPDDTARKKGARPQPPAPSLLKGQGAISLPPVLRRPQDVPSLALCGAPSPPLRAGTPWERALRRSGPPPSGQAVLSRQTGAWGSSSRLLHQPLQQLTAWARGRQRSEGPPRLPKSSHSWGRPGLSEACRGAPGAGQTHPLRKEAGDACDNFQSFP